MPCGSGMQDAVPAHRPAVHGRRPGAAAMRHDRFSRPAGPAERAAAGLCGGGVRGYGGGEDADEGIGDLEAAGANAIRAEALEAA